MAPQDPVQQSDSSTSTPIATPSPVPPPIPVETHPNRGQFRPPSRSSTDPSRLAPEDAYKHLSPPRLRPLHEIQGLDDTQAASAAAAALRPAVASLRAPPAIPPVAARLEQERRQRNASRKRRQQPRVWKKLLWIKQHGFPDNYTDTETFLDHLQRNPRLRPYELWPLVIDSTVIVQHVCSVAVFISAYAGIYQDRLSPVAVVTCGTVAALVGWIMWDQWMGEEEAEGQVMTARAVAVMGHEAVAVSNGVPKPSLSNGHANGHVNGHANGTSEKQRLGLSLSTSNLAAKNDELRLTTTKHVSSLSRSSFQSISPIDPLSEPFPNFRNSLTQATPSPQMQHSATSLPPSISLRNQVRLKTFKSALLIYFALLGLSPILKSLTKSTSSDSIWALATWLLIINIFFFDYGSVYEPQNRIRTAPTTKPATASSPVAFAKPSSTIPNGNATTATISMIPSKPFTTTRHHHSSNRNASRTRPVSMQPTNHATTTTNTSSASSTTSIKPLSAPPFPSSLSTNAALMASTVLASRLPTTTSVFSLSLFSIQVFGLFPVFRRHLRYKSPQLHLLMTIALIAMSSVGLFLILSQSYTHTYGDCGYCIGWLWHVTVRSVGGVLVGGLGTMFVMGACSWWLITLQRYKNVVIGPWDPAKPVLAGGVSVLGRGRGGTD